MLRWFRVYLAAIGLSILFYLIKLLGDALVHVVMLPTLPGVEYRLPEAAFYKLVMAIPWLLATGACLYLFTSGRGLRLVWLSGDELRGAVAGSVDLRKFWQRSIAPFAQRTLLFVGFIELPLALLLIGHELEAFAVDIVSPHGLLASFGDAAWAHMRPQPVGTAMDVVGAILTLGLIVPICEEVIFRGLILGLGLAASRNDSDPALYVFLVVQSLLLALPRLLIPWEFAVIFPLGILLGWLRIRLGSLVLPIALHVIINTVTVIQIYVWPDVPLFGGDPRLIENAPLFISIPAFGLLCYSMYYIFSITRRSEERRADPAEGDAA